MVTRDLQQTFLAYRARPSKETLLALLSAYQGTVYNICFHILRNAHDAEDTAQEVLLEVLEGVNRLPDPAAFDRWVYRVATNSALDSRKKRSRRQAHETQRAAMKTSDSPPEELIQGVHEALGHLDDDLRRLVIQHYFERRTLEDLASTEGCSTAAVWKRIEKGKERIRQALAATTVAGLVVALDRVLQAAEPITPPPGLISDALVTKAEVVAKAFAPVAGKGISLVVGGIVTVCLLGLIAVWLFREKPSESGRQQAQMPTAPRGQGDIGNASPGHIPPTSATPAVGEPAPQDELSGKLLIRVTDLSRGERLTSFRFAVQVSGGGYFQHLSKTDEFETAITLPKGSRQATAEVRLLDPEIRDEGRQKIAILADQRITVDLVVRSGEEIVGFVVAKSGAPVADALVFVGTQEIGRGDEPFKPFRPGRVLDGVRTDAAGRFVLRKYGALVTVFHEEFSPITVLLNDSWRIVLPPRGSIKGRILASDGSPLRAAPISLDQERQTTTDEQGRFEFAKVDAGTRGIYLPGKRTVAVSLQPGQDLEVEVGAGLPEVTLDLSSVPEGLAKGTLGAVVGLEGVASSHGIRGPAREARLQGVLPGRYVLITTTGLIGRVDLSASTARADFGTAGLEITSDVERRVYLIPDGAHELVEVMTKRLALRKCAPGAALTYSPLPAGDYILKNSDGTTLSRVQVIGPGTRLAMGAK